MLVNSRVSILDQKGIKESVSVGAQRKASFKYGIVRIGFSTERVSSCTQRVKS